MGRFPGCTERGVNKGPWTPNEDEILAAYIRRHGLGSWRALPKKAGLSRCGKSCRLRWTNYLRPDIKRGRFSSEEEQIVVHLHALLGNKWSAIATYLPGRTDNEIKNVWNFQLGKELERLGIDPMTHKARPGAKRAHKRVVSCVGMSHISQWARVRTEMEASLAIPPRATPPQLANIPALRSFDASFVPPLPPLPDPFNNYDALLQSLKDACLSGPDHITDLEPNLISTEPFRGQTSGGYVSQTSTPDQLLDSFSTMAIDSSDYSQLPQYDGIFPSMPTLGFQDQLPKPIPALRAIILGDLSSTSSTLSSSFGSTTVPTDQFVVPPPPTSDDHHHQLSFETPARFGIPKVWPTTQQLDSSSLHVTSAPPAMVTTMTIPAPSDELLSLPDVDELQLDAAADLPALLMEVQLSESPVAGSNLSTSASSGGMISSAASNLRWTSPQSASDSKDYWATMLHLVGPFPPRRRRAYRIKS